MRRGCRTHHNFPPSSLERLPPIRTPRRIARCSPSRMYVSGLHSIVCSPEGVLSVTLYAARTEGRAARAPTTEVFLSRRAILEVAGGGWGMRKRELPVCERVIVV